MEVEKLPPHWERREVALILDQCSVEIVCRISVSKSFLSISCTQCAHSSGAKDWSNQFCPSLSKSFGNVARPGFLNVNVVDILSQYFFDGTRGLPYALSHV